MNNLVKLVTFSCSKNPIGRVGLVVGSNRILDLAAAGKFDPELPNLGKDMFKYIEGEGATGLATARLKELLNSKSFENEDLLALSNVKLLPPINLPKRNVFCVGKNYIDHVAEVAAVHSSRESNPNSVKDDSVVSVELPKYAQFFTKAPQTVIANGDDVENHSGITKVLDYEVELAVIIGKKGRDIAKDDAMNYVFGYTIANDITARDLQRKHNQWFKGKSLDTTCPMGPFVVPKNEINASDLAIKMSINGELRQNSRTSKMIFGIREIIEQLSAGLTLYPGDVILTGTPKGVGFAMKPPQVLKAGDVMEAEIEHIGKLVNRVV